MSALDVVHQDNSIIGISRPTPPNVEGGHNRRRSDSIAWAGVAVLLVGILLMFFGRAVSSILFPTAVPFELQATDVDGQMRIRWSGHAEYISEAESATLEVTDGNQNYVYPVSRDVLESGALDYSRKTDDVVATLVLRRNGQETQRRIVRSISAPKPH